MENIDENIVENIDENQTVEIKPARVVTPEIIIRANIINGMQPDMVEARINAVFDLIEAENHG